MQKAVNENSLFSDYRAAELTRHSPENFALKAVQTTNFL
jgi:hypothetical protein